MYNQRQKIDFINSTKSNLAFKDIAISVFNHTEKWEFSNDKDICKANLKEITTVVEEIIKENSLLKWSVLTVLRKYVSWYKSENPKDYVADAVFELSKDELAKERNKMVSTPLEFQAFLDALFQNETEKTVANVHRGYLWLIFSGVHKDDTVNIRTKDVDMEEMVIRYNGDVYPIYREAYLVFKNLKTLKKFNYIHPNYESKFIVKERAAGDILLRGIKGAPSATVLANKIAKDNLEAVKKGVTDKRVSPDRAYKSGVFYRAYEGEKREISPDFGSEVDFKMGDTNYALPDHMTRHHIKNRYVRQYMQEYYRWKLAFGLE